MNHQNFYKVRLGAFLLSTFFLNLGFVNGQNCATPGKDGLGSISGIVNTYFPGNTASLTAGSTTVTLGAGSGSSTSITAGDLVLIIQMQGADIGFSNSNTYGDGTASTPANGYTVNANLAAGLYEYAVATNSVTLAGGSLTILTGTTNAYYSRNNTGGATQGQARYQVIRVPQYSSATITANVQALHWNGSVGGIIALDVSGVLNFNGFTIDASGSGFRGGGGRSLAGGTGANTDYVVLSTNLTSGQKAEGIAGTPAYVWDGVTSSNAGIINTGVEGYPNGSSSKGAPGNAGGGAQDGDPTGNSQNSGGGGGSNGGLGGNGGNTWSSNLADGGYPGATFAQVATNRLVMGGGGGAGSANNSATNPYLISGTPGGGIVMIRAGKVTGTGTINVNGKNGLTVVSDCCADGAGGAGAGGSVLLVCSNTTGLNNITITANGGIGGNSNAVDHGPGGGGGGGVVYCNGITNAATSVAGAANGYALNAGTFYGATAGSSGLLLQSGTVDPLNQMVGYKCIAPPIANNITAPVENNSYGQTAIPSLSGSDAYGTIDAFVVTTIPTAAQGVLYLCNPSCTAVTAGQTVLAADQAKLKFDPAGTFTGNASFTYTAINSQNVTSNTATYTIPVNNLPPVADNILSQVLNNSAGAKSIPSLAAADADGTISSYTITTVPSSAVQGLLTLCNPTCTPVTANQVISLSDIGKLQFNPLATFTGTASFNYTATDNSGSVSLPASYNIPVKGSTNINVAPFSDNMLAPQISNSSGAALLPVLSAHDADGTIASYKIETIPSAAQGSLTYCSNGTEPCTGTVTPVTAGITLTAAQAATLKFTPAATFTGTATFTYSATDNSGNISNIANYSIPVIDIPPVANPVTTDPMTNTFGQTAIPPLSGHDPSSITGYTISTIPAGASGILYLCNPGCNPVTAGQTVALIDIGKFKFDPAAGFTGNATFNYTATDNNGVVSQPAPYTIPVSSATFPTDLPPVANNVTSAVIPNTSGQTAITSLSGSDPDGTVSNYIINSIPAINQGVLYLCNPTCNPVTIGQQISTADAASLKFAPVTGYMGNAIFDYSAKDNNGKTGNIATYTIPVTANQPNAFNVQSAALAVTSPQTAISSLSGSETAGTIASYTINNLPSAASGILYLCNPSCTAVTIGQVIVAGDASKLQFAPSSAFNGIYTQFNYTATDNTGVLSNPATFIIPLTVNNLLPVSLLLFTVDRQGSFANLHWVTADEINFRKYVVERSTDGISFTAFATKIPNGGPRNDYYVSDNIESINSPVIYYHIQMIDLDGKTKYSPVVVLNTGGNFKKAISVSPNPATENIQFKISSDVTALADIQVISSIGQVLFHSKQQVYKGDNVIAMQYLSATLSKGTYMVRAIIDRQVLSTKFVFDK